MVKSLRDGRKMNMEKRKKRICKRFRFRILGSVCPGKRNERGEEKLKCSSRV
jgi:hypothetical protein